MHVVDAVVHDSRRDAVARVTERPCRLHVQIQLRYATSLTSVVLHTHTLFRKTAPKNEQHIQNLKILQHRQHVSTLDTNILYPNVFLPSKFDTIIGLLL